MNIRRYEPWGLLSDINQLFDDTWGRSCGVANTEKAITSTANWVPLVDIQEQSDQYVIHADLPGIDKKDVEISYKDNILAISGERKSEVKTEKDKFKKVERHWGRFERYFTLPDTADGESIMARIDKGVLEVVIPKKASSQTRKIEVKD